MAVSYNARASIQARNSSSKAFLDAQNNYRYIFHEMTRALAVSSKQAKLVIGGEAYPVRVTEAEMKDTNPFSIPDVNIKCVLNDTAIIKKDGVKQTHALYGTPTIKQVIFNEPATIVIWSDGVKTVVKARGGDKFDPKKGLAIAVAKRMLGNKYEYYNEFKKWLKKGGYKCEH